MRTAAITPKARLLIWRLKAEPGATLAAAEQDVDALLRELVLEELRRLGIAEGREVGDVDDRAKNGRCTDQVAAYPPFTDFPGGGP